jgi:phage-related protein
MEKNTDAKIVVMDTEVFDYLLHLATAGKREIGGDLDRVMKHIRKFNTPRAEQFAQERKDIRAQYVKERQELRSMLIHCGKEVYLRETRGVYRPVKLLGKVVQWYPGSDLLLRVKKKPLSTMDVHYQNIVLELPEKCRLITMGNLRGCYEHIS